MLNVKAHIGIHQKNELKYIHTKNIWKSTDIKQENTAWNIDSNLPDNTFHALVSPNIFKSNTIRINHLEVLKC